MAASASASELPQDLIGEVLLRLPAKSIGRFRCVSKPWRSLLTSPKFAKSHRDFHINAGATSIIVPISDVPLHLLIINLDGNSRKVTSPFFVGQSIVLHAACHGFVLVELEHAILLFNPLTLEAMEVPEAKLHDEETDNYNRISHYGLGYDSLSDDYKIVRLLNYNRNSSRREFDGKYVEVYSLKKKSWSRIASIPYRHHDIYHNYVWFVNGRLHWRAWGNERGYLLVAFHLTREEMEEISFSPPSEENPLHWAGCSLAVFGGCLAAVWNLSGDCRIDIWVKECGSQESWIAIDTKDGFKGEFICLSGEDELVFRSFTSDNLVVYSLSTGVWREWDTGVDGVGRFLPFTECLLSPNHISN